MIHIMAQQKAQYALKILMNEFRNSAISSKYRVRGPVLGTGDTAVNKQKKPCRAEEPLWFKELLVAAAL